MELCLTHLFTLRLDQRRIQRSCYCMDFPGTSATWILPSPFAALVGMFSTLTIVAPGAPLETSLSITALKMRKRRLRICVTPRMQPELRSDGKTIVLVGHSMGGFVALEVGALDSAISAIVTISAADLGTSRLQAVPADKRQFAIKGLAASLEHEGMAPLAGTSPEKLANEVLSNATHWSFVNLAPKLSTRRLLVITSDDGLAVPNNALVDAVEKLGDQEVRAIHIPTDHSYSDHRIALQQVVLNNLRLVNQK